MTEPKSFSYTTHLDIKFDPLALIDVDQLAKSVTDQWYNQTLCRVNDSVVRLGVMQGEYHWHKRLHGFSIGGVVCCWYVYGLIRRVLVICTVLNLGNTRV